MLQVTKVGCLSDIASIVNLSASMNHPQLVGDQSGNVIVKTYNQITFFQDHVIKFTLKGIKSKEPATVYVRDITNNAERKIKILKDMLWRPSSSDLPHVVTPQSLSLTRQ